MVSINTNTVTHTNPPMARSRLFPWSAQMDYVLVFMSLLVFGLGALVGTLFRDDALWRIYNAEQRRADFWYDSYLELAIKSTNAEPEPEDSASTCTPTQQGT